MNALLSKAPGLLAVAVSVGLFYHRINRSAASLTPRAPRLSPGNQIGQLTVVTSTENI